MFALTLSACATDDPTASPDPERPVYACPDGMIGVPNDAPAVCVDTYEVVVRDGIAVSVAGEIPTVAIAFVDARAACAATPALDADGDAYDVKSLVSSADWQDAGDGVVGDGGTLYPWGDAWQEGACATPSATGEVTLDDLQPTGAYPDCRGAFGAYDQVGNAWEWTDPGMDVDIAASLAAGASEGLPLRTDGDGVLHLDAGDVSRLLVGIIGVDPGAAELDAEGRLGLSRDRIQRDPEGWVGMGGLLSRQTPPGQPAVPTDFVPVRIYPADDRNLEGPWLLHLDEDRDGAPITDKRGCAYYTGNDYACALDKPFHDHIPDFTGTIGFRCAAPPYLADD
jgi:hypothetical protein